MTVSFVASKRLKCFILSVYCEKTSTMNSWKCRSLISGFLVVQKYLLIMKESKLKLNDENQFETDADLVIHSVQ